MSFKWTILFILLGLSSALLRAQEVVLVNQNNEVLDDLDFITMILRVNNDTKITLNSPDGHFILPDSLCTEQIDIRIDQQPFQPFHNQYLCDQLQSLDTIRVHQKFLIKSQTPRFFQAKIENLDSVMLEHLWMGEWLIDRRETIKRISFSVYNSDPLKRAVKKSTKAIIERYCEKIGFKEFAKRIEYENEAYATGQEDLFNEGTCITRGFIDNQNTELMRGIAEKYSLVVIIDWNRE
jgi:hypothetical protein